MRQRKQALGFQGWNIVERCYLGMLLGTRAPRWGLVCLTPWLGHRLQRYRLSFPSWWDGGPAPPERCQVDGRELVRCLLFPSCLQLRRIFMPKWPTWGWIFLFFFVSRSTRILGYQSWACFRLFCSLTQKKKNDIWKLFSNFPTPINLRTHKTPPWINPPDFWTRKKSKGEKSPLWKLRQDWSQQTAHSFLRHDRRTTLCQMWVRRWH